LDDCPVIEETAMAIEQIGFLVMVVGAFAVFGVTLAYVDWWHRQGPARSPRRETASEYPSGARTTAR
jgi:hypothetical protein